MVPVMFFPVVSIARKKGIFCNDITEQRKIAEYRGEGLRVLSVLWYTIHRSFPYTKEIL